MTARVVLDQLLLAGSVAALVGAGMRLASRLVAGGIERALAGATFAAAAAAAEALGLGLVGAGGDQTALALAGVATYAAARTILPAAALGPGAELAGWLRRAPRWTVAGVGAAAGIVVGWIAWQLRHPLIGPDALTYHLPIATAWVQNGRPGSVVTVVNGLPFGNYPLTNELLVAWALGISRSWVTVSIWSPVLFVGVAAGGWVALRELGVGAGVRGLAVIAVCIPPLMVGQLGAPYTDIAALAWLCVAAGLATAARREPRLVHAAVVAAGLCVGTKTTPAILVLVLAGVAWRPLRGAGRCPLAAAVSVAVVVGGVWSVRNLVVHGSPLWPLVSAPWGDPVPATFRALGGRFLDHPRHLIGAYWRSYLTVLGGAAVLIGSGLALPVVRGSRAALAAAGAAGLALVAWGGAPYTGVANHGAIGAIANTRYLLPAIAACALATAVSARGAGRVLRLTVMASLVGSIGYSVVKTAAFGPLRPSLAALVVAGAAGAGAAGAAPPAARAAGAGWRERVGVGGRRERAGVGGGVAGVLVGVAVVVGLALGADGYRGRYLAADHPPDRDLYAVATVSRGSDEIASWPGVFVLLRGESLERRLAVIGDGESCAGVRARLRRGPVVLATEPASPVYRRLAGCLAGVSAVRIGSYEEVYAGGGGGVGP